ncbi:glycosyltransferase family 4 protein [Thermococcus aggregans]|uniref:Glycosyltransferase family 4 protein n=1 Tax=Thermococcus aggregans TaxID=110163 RepID=A0A9E7MYG3_THEAG|nr:glycosyltransferase family 4 protein [Thermococcus aggregans]USS41091.1 glycosyltransferase family 4 protein [Thermococcus aggregans]
MRIAFIYDVVYPYVKGGVEKRLYELGKRLARKHEVVWFTLKWWEGKDTIEKDGIQIISVGDSKTLYHGGRRSISEAIYFAWKMLLKGSLGDFDVIDCQEFPYLSCYTSRLNLPKGASFVITWHEFWGKYWKDYLGSAGIVGVKIEKGLTKLTRHHIAVSKITKDYLKEIGVSAALVPNGIDFKKIDKIKKGERSFDFLFVGRLVRHKNVDFLLRSIAHVKREHPDITLGIIGDGPERDNLELLARELGISSNVEFLGFLENHEEVISTMKSSKVFAFPSLREGFGIVVLEANASGLPAVVVDHPLNASKDLIVPWKNGFVSKNSEKDFAEHLIVAYEHKKRLGKTAKSVAKKYDWDLIAKELEKYYRGILNG